MLPLANVLNLEPKKNNSSASAEVLLIRLTYAYLYFKQHTEDFVMKRIALSKIMKEDSAAHLLCILIHVSLGYFSPNSRAHSLNYSMMTAGQYGLHYFIT